MRKVPPNDRLEKDVRLARLRSHALRFSALAVREENPVMSPESAFFDGGCTCRFVRYRMTSRPLFVHCCHCRWCQRETGASFALNALIEADRVQLLQGKVEVIDT